ncbi:MAG: hypothetical protein WC736_15585 [Gallionella sp.]|jgi:hypothetical protein
MLTSIDVPEDLMKRIDEFVAARKAAKAEPYRCNEAEKLHAKMLADTQGLPAANAFLKSLQPPKLPASRGAVICELAQIALSMLPPEKLGKTEAPSTRLPPPRKTNVRVHRIVK